MNLSGALQDTETIISSHGVALGYSEDSEQNADRHETLPTTSPVQQHRISTASPENTVIHAEQIQGKVTPARSYDSYSRVETRSVGVESAAKDLLSSTDLRDASLTNTTKEETNAAESWESFVRKPTLDPRFQRLMEQLVPLPNKRNDPQFNNRRGRLDSTKERPNLICFKDICLRDTCRIVFDIMKIENPKEDP